MGDHISHGFDIRLTEATKLDKSCDSVVQEEKRSGRTDQRGLGQRDQQGRRRYRFVWQAVVIVGA